LSAKLLLPSVPREGVLIQVAAQLLSPLLLLLFVLAIVSAVLSTIVSAVLAPAAVLAQNLVQPLRERISKSSNPQAGLVSQRICVLAVVCASVLLALSGSGTYELVESSYSLSLVSLFAAFTLGLHFPSAPRVAALASMMVGLGLWLLHTLLQWEYFLEPMVVSGEESGFLRIFSVLPHELGDTALATLVFLLLWVSVWFLRRGRVLRGPSCRAAD
jgi:solute:Na+ symporter, SSS family